MIQQDDVMKITLVKLIFNLLLICYAIVGIEIPQSQASTYPSSDLDKSQLCGGWPRIKKIKMPMGFCLGLVDDGLTRLVSHNPNLKETTLLLPRSLVQIDENHFLVIDQGSKDSSIKGGQYFLLTLGNGETERTLLASSSYNPSKIPSEAFYRTSHIAKWQNRYYVGTTRAIYSFNLVENKLDDFRIEISNTQISNDAKELSSELHPLKTFIFDNQGNLIVNIGSPSNNCRTTVSKSAQEDCLERNSRAQLRLYHRTAEGSYNSNYEVIAYGLRNSMAMAFHPEHPNWLFQGENSRDAIHKALPSPNVFGDGKGLPQEELNLIDLKKYFASQSPFDFGWPYCYGDNQSSPEYPKVKCSNRQAPHILLPAHSAPLGMLYHSGKNWPSIYKNALLMSWHGYEYTGHRIVFLQEKANGLPQPDIYNLVWGWGIESDMLLGSPVQLFEADDGSVYITDDNNHSILRLYFEPQYLNQEFDAQTRPTVKVEEDYKEIVQFYKQNKFEELKAKKQLQKRLAQTKPPLFSKIQANLIDKHCAECHKIKDDSMMLAYNDIFNADFLKRKKLVVPYKTSESPFFTYLQNGVMPPSGMPDAERAALNKLVEEWINSGAPTPE